jgi:PIN domain nuclease of toxin-antitoxin system
MRFLLDSHILIWWLEQSPRLSAAARRVITRARSGKGPPLLVAEISLWEIANLHDLGRVQLSMALKPWLERATAAPLVERVGISAEIAAEVTALPKNFQRDPADRLLVATARVLAATLVTADVRIRDASICATLF